MLPSPPPLQAASLPVRRFSHDSPPEPRLKLADAGNPYGSLQNRQGRGFRVPLSGDSGSPPTGEWKHAAARAGCALPGKYEVLCRLSTGGMAEIFLASPRGRAGFRAFNHPYIAQVDDLDIAEGELFLSLEFVPGATLVEVARACRQANHLIPLGFSLISPLRATAARFAGHGGRSKCSQIAHTPPGAVRDASTWRLPPHLTQANTSRANVLRRSPAQSHRRVRSFFGSSTFAPKDGISSSGSGFAPAWRSLTLSGEQSRFPPGLHATQQHGWEGVASGHRFASCRR